MVFLFRKSGGQVLGASTSAAAYAGIDATFFGTVTDPTTPDGADLGVMKVAVGTVVRNATAAEVTAANAAAVSDQNLSDRATAINWLQTNPVQRKILRAIVSAIVDELNDVRTDPTTVKVARTPAQAYTAIIGKINNGSVD